MKNILFSFILLLTLIFPFTDCVKAREQNVNLYIAPYINAQDLVHIFDNSTQVLDYLDGKEIDQPVALFTADADDFENLKSFGIRPELIEENPDMSRYIYLYHPSTDKASTLSYLGRVYAITNHHTLVRLDKPEDFRYKGEIVRFSMLPLGQKIEKPPGILITLPPPVEIPKHTYGFIEKYWATGAVIIVFLGISIYLLYRKRMLPQR